MSLKKVPANTKHDFVMVTLNMRLKIRMLTHLNIYCSHPIAAVFLPSFKSYSTFNVVKIDKGTPIALDSKCVFLTGIPPVASLPLATPNIKRGSSVLNMSYI
jgi:hypothetical protein